MFVVMQFNHGAADVPAVVQELRATFKSGKTLPRDWRMGQLLAMQRMCTEGKDELLNAMQSDLHKSTFEGVRSSSDRPRAMPGPAQCKLNPRTTRVLLLFFN